ncbi:MAG: RNA methyltransferase [Dethiobacter sp.]|nr:RNA methyltransferase [Dethiobacter sp.]
MTHPPISSPDNPLIKEYLRLKRSRKYRRSAGKLAVEGPNLLEQALAAGLLPEAVIYTVDYGCGKGAPLLSALPGSVKQVQVSKPLFAKLTATETPQEVAALIPFQEPDHAQFFSVPLSLALFLDRLQDPGNMGTVLRTAAAAGAEAVFYSPGSADPFSAKVLRSTAGAIFNIPVAMAREPLKLLREFKRAGIQIAAAAPSAQHYYWSADFSRPTLFIIGNEKGGISPELSAAADISVNIPLTGGQGSLNAAVAAAVLIFEAIRQRRSGS